MRALLLTEERGVTLIETLVSVSILLVVVVTTTSVLFVAQGSHQQMAAWGDRTQQLRIALQQITSDLSHAQWDDTYAGTDKLQEFSVRTYQPITSKDIDSPCSDSDWTGLSAWPGDLCEFPEVTIHYEIKGDALIREVLGDGVSASRSTLAVPLTPLSNVDGSENPDGSYFLMPNSGPDAHTITIRLAAQRGTSGVKRLAHVYSRYYLPGR